MHEFLQLEGGYLAIAAFVLGVATFIATRPFMPPGAPRRIIPITLAVLLVFIGLHYFATRHRIQSVVNAFEAGRTILCENRSGGRMTTSIEIRRAAGWQIRDGLFVNDDYERPFHPARCVVGPERPPAPAG